LTTRIECSRPRTTTLRQIARYRSLHFESFRLAPSHRWQARQPRSERHDSHRLCGCTTTDESAWTPRSRCTSSLFHGPRSRNRSPNRCREPWENASDRHSWPHENGHERRASTFFQDANYHDQIVKEQNEPAVQKAPTARDPVPLRHLPSLARPWTEVRSETAERASTHGQITS